MRKTRKILGIVLVMGLCMSALAACTKTTDNNNSAIESETEKKNDILDSDVYEEFLEGNNTISLDYYKDNVLVEGEYQTPIDDEISNLASDNQKYTISELKDAFKGIFENDIELMKYAYIDCGSDGAKEMVLQIQNPKDEYNNYYFVIKEIGSELQVTYIYEEEIRIFKRINKCGYIATEDSDGCFSHGTGGEYINAEGKYEYGYHLEKMTRFGGFAGEIERQYDLTDIKGDLYTYFLHIEPTNTDDFNTIYSYEVYDEETEEKKDIPNLYTDSPYKKVMDFFHDKYGNEFVTMDEIYKKIDDKLESIGVTEQILLFF